MIGSVRSSVFHFSWIMEISNLAHPSITNDLSNKYKIYLFTKHLLLLSHGTPTDNHIYKGSFEAFKQKNESNVSDCFRVIFLIGFANEIIVRRYWIVTVEIVWIWELVITWWSLWWFYFMYIFKTINITETIHLIRIVILILLKCNFIFC